MSTIRDTLSSSYYDKNDWESFSNAQKNSSAFLSGVSLSTDSSGEISLADYAMIKNGSYRKLTKAYYAKQKAENNSGTRDSSQRLTKTASDATALSKAAASLRSDSLWQKKEVTTKDEMTGEEKTSMEYDRKAIAKAVKAFVDSYNSVVEDAGKSYTKDILRNASWMTKTTSVSEGLLKKVGITIGKGNKLEIDDEELEKADISTLKTLFSGHNSYASKLQAKGDAITNAASRAGSVYTKSGSYSNTLSGIVPSGIDEKE